MKVALTGVVLALTVACSGECERWMVFGDSLAYQMASQRPGVLNAGVPSERLAQSLANSDDLPMAGESRIALAMLGKPTTVLVMAGTNDVLEGVWQQEHGRMTEDQWMADVELALASVIRQASMLGAARVLVSTIPPQRTGTRRNRDPYAAVIPVMNDRIRRVAVRCGATVVDSYTMISADLDRFVSEDDVHLTSDGYKAVWSLVTASQITRRAR